MQTPNVQHYFNQVAPQWDALRSEYFTAAMRDDAIARAQLPPNAVVADIGTGTGFVAGRLAQLFANVCGFDANPAMLAIARQKLAHLANVEFHQAEGSQIPVSTGSFDGVFANMYLHHAPDPFAAIQEMARITKVGGVVCITDLDTHHHEWQHAVMADLWLGFERTQIKDWFEQAGLTAVEVDCAAGSCCAVAPDGSQDALSIFVAIGRKA
ncbi:MAG TPA: methyltransferase domain-containing protein [Anaerolineales bacterium]|nr:methyltransferase domain-containing protein [Anaerolineales bacterium]